MNKTARLVLTVISIVVIGTAVLLIGIVVGRSDWGLAGYGPGMMGRLGIMGRGFGLGSIVTIIFWVVIVAMIVWLIGSFASRTPSNPPSGTTTGNAPMSALEILKQRYARGEISKADYEAMRRDIEA